MNIGKIKKGWQELNSEIIQTGKCVYCGACGAFCANIKFDPEKEIPIEDGSCEDMNTCRDGYGLCYNLCPKTEIKSIPISLLDKWVFAKKQDQILGHFIDIITVKVTEKGRDIIPSKAGVISSLLWTAMDVGLIDSSIVTDKDEEFRPYPFIADNKSDIFKGAGYKPSQSPTLSLIGDAINKEYTDIAVVGTPCQIQALRKIQNHPVFDFEVYDLVTLTIGTFCFGTFYNQILKTIIEEKGISTKEILKVDSNKESFKLRFKTNNGSTEIPLSYIYDKAIRKACFTCSDYTASFADISVGKVGSENGWHTLIIRTERGKEIVNAAIKRNYIESKSLEKDKEDIILELTRHKTDLVKIESIASHSSEIKSFKFRNKRIAQSYKPGMFVILWLPDIDFLPMSVSKVEGNLLEVTVQKIGEGTSKLFDLMVGDTIGIRGPFGNAFSYEDSNNILIVGGGMGIAALTSIIEPLKANKKNVFVTIGAQDESSLIFAERLIDLIPNTMCATDDGSVGRKCMVTDTIEEVIDKEKIDLIITCGPELMMKRVLEIADSKNIAIQASLERKMKCGVGLCGSCCIGEKNDISVCKEGPVFSRNQLESFPQFGSYKK
jgi:dihydroorotate dehydrogenase electron transfer subunit